MTREIEEVIEIGVLMNAFSLCSALFVLAHSLSSLVYQSWLLSLQRAMPLKLEYTVGRKVTQSHSKVMAQYPAVSILSAVVSS